jgi:ribosome-associated heat shock protein Hsp15
MPEPLITLRADKYLHHVRLFKTRTLATQACDRSNVKIEGHVIKPARALKPGDVLQVERGDLKMTVRVLALPPLRLGAPLVKQFYEDLTPPENYQKAAEISRERALVTPRPHDTLMRPTKKDLRAIREWMGRD